MPASRATPSLDETDLVSSLRLIRSRRVGPATFHRLIGEYGSARRALDALPDVARAAGDADYRPCSQETAEREIAAGYRAGARLIHQGAPDYPVDLARITDAPPLLWMKGRMALASRPAVALVGARNASSLGTRTARLLASDLGRDGLIIVSGLARGVDTAAHLAALQTGTVAVLAGGIDQIYPRENVKLAEDIVATGMLISERPPGLYPQARDFPRRNRLISGLAQAVIVVEAAARSGSLITARDALDQGRDVMAVPGHPLDARAAGCNMLIRDGAVLVRGSRDVLAALSARSAPELGTSAPGHEVAVPADTKPRASIPEALEISRRILSLLGPSPVPEDQVIRELELPAQAVSTQLVALELDGKLERQRGGMLSRVV
ncbi:MAG: DNA-processing protein DprA [Paracoccaceae bacterium]